MKTSKSRPNWTFRLAGLMFCLIMVSTLIVTDLFAKYSGKGGEDDEARVASFVFCVEDESAAFVIPMEQDQPGALVEYPFIVTNENERGQVCETAQRYEITIQLEGSLPLVCTLEKDDKKELEIDALAAPQVLPKEKSCTGTFLAAEKSEELYTLTIEWPKEADRMDPKFMGGAAEVEVKVVSAQID